jgi:23S rRNA pseudouridine2604 synthase
MSDPVTDPVRLAKCVADLARCSRLEAEQYIKGGWVAVDGRVVEDPAHPVTTESVSLDPAAQLETVEPATILLHKPVGYDTSGTQVRHAPAWCNRHHAGAEDPSERAPARSAHSTG